MIEINLVPTSLRKRKKSSGLLGRTLVIPREAVVGLVGGIVALLLLVHIVLQSLITVRFVHHKKLQSDLTRISSQKTNVDRIVSELKGLRERYQSIEAVAGEKNIVWSQKLNEISDNIPRGVWLNRIMLDGNTLLIQGSAVSKNKTEMIHVHNYTSNLKASEAFMSDFAELELGLIKSRKINLTPVADFTIRADLKETKE